MLLNVKSSYVLMLILLTVLVTGCAVSCPPQPVESPKVPPAPALPMLKNSQTYSARAASDIQEWRKMLTDGKVTQ